MPGNTSSRAGLADLVEVREGDALRTLARDLPDRVDLLLLDGAKALYPEILNLVEPRLRPGAFVIADDADMSPDYLARVRSPASGYLSTSVGEDVGAFRPARLNGLRRGNRTCTYLSPVRLAGVGSAVVAELIGAGHRVTGLARSEEKVAALAASGAVVLRATLDDHGVLRVVAAVRMR